MKIFLPILLFISFIPFIVNAETCDANKVSISSISVYDKTGSIAEIDSATTNDKTIDLNLSMFDVGDSIQYEIVVNNESDEEYVIDADNFIIPSNYMKYQLSSEDDSNIVSAKSSKALYLTVEYKNAIPENAFDFQTYHDNQTFNIQLISGDTFHNPNTGTTFLLVILLIIMIVDITYMTAQKKKKSKYPLFIIGVIILIPISVYATCQCSITVNANVSVRKESSLFDMIQNSVADNSCITKYDGLVTDEVDSTVTANNVYFDTCENRNIIFGNYCWQIIRTTETEGTKVIYNGEPVNGKCESTRGNHKGIIGSNGTSKKIDNSYLYGDSFTYDVDTGTFHLVDTFTSTWNDTNYEELLSKYTCLSNSDSCSTIYFINSYKSNTHAFVSSYSIGDTHYSQIGTSPFNSNNYAFGMIGYQFNKLHEIIVYENEIFNDAYLWGTDFTYNSATNTYTVTGDTALIRGSTSLDQRYARTYSCLNNTGTCSKIYYMYYLRQPEAEVIALEGGMSAEDALSEALNAPDVNQYDSNIKSIIENWYDNNFDSYTNSLENNVYCDYRKISSSWSSRNAITACGMGSCYSSLDYDNLTDLSCNHITDQFSVENGSARLHYPIGLATSFELSQLGSTYYSTGNNYWIFSKQRRPSFTGIVNTYGSITNSNLNSSYGIRPVVTINSHHLIIDGDGTESNPWIVRGETIVD